MVFYYTIHSMTSKGEKESDGAKNCRTFLFGSVIYIILLMVVMHYSLKNRKICGILKTGLLLLFIVDIATMAYIYRSYYGRLITNELLPTDDSKKEWKYDEKKHKYQKKTNTDKEIEEEIENIKNDYNKREIDKLKEKIDNSGEYHFDTEE